MLRWTWLVSQPFAACSCPEVGRIPGAWERWAEICGCKMAAFRLQNPRNAVFCVLVRLTVNCCVSPHLQAACCAISGWPVMSLLAFLNSCVSCGCAHDEDLQNPSLFHSLITPSLRLPCR